MNTCLFGSLILVLFCATGAAAAKVPEFGAPSLWLPDLVSTPATEVRITFSPDGKRMLWGAIGWKEGVGGWDIYESVRTSAGWSKPLPVAFDSAANEFDPSFAPDGSGVYFFSNRPGGVGGDDIYFAAFDGKAYGAVRNLGSEINTAKDEWAPVVSPDGQRLMFASDGRGGKGKHDLFVARRNGTQWIDAGNLGDLNTLDDDFDATFLHDGSTIVYASGDLEGAITLYLAEFRNGKYQPRIKLPDAMNGMGPDATALGPAISMNEKNILYFTAVRPEGKGRADIYRVEYLH